MSDHVETAKQLARRVGISEYQIRKLISTGQLEHVKIGYRLHIPAGGWERFIEANKKGGELWHDETKAQSSVGSGGTKPELAPMPRPIVVDELPQRRFWRRQARRASPKVETMHLPTLSLERTPAS